MYDRQIIHHVYELEVKIHVKLVQNDEKRSFEVERPYRLDTF